MRNEIKIERKRKIAGMGDRAVDCARLESVCAERHRGFESPPIRPASRQAFRRIAVLNACAENRIGCPLPPKKDALLRR